MSDATKTANHCADCCCARSWAALGITEYTGKSIPEHITELKLELAAAKEANEKLKSRQCIIISVGQLFDAIAMAGSDDIEMEIIIEKMKAWKCADTEEQMPDGLYAHYYEYPEEGLFGPLTNIADPSDTLRARIGELEADGRRLDWLDEKTYKHAPFILNTDECPNNSARQAIDTAMAQGEGK